VQNKSEDHVKTENAVTFEPIELTVKPDEMRWARYRVAETGHFSELGVQFTGARDPIVIDLVDHPELCEPVAYTSATARAAASQLLGYAHRLEFDNPLPRRVRITLLESTSRTATTSTWELGGGLAVRYLAPFSSTLISDVTAWTLTAEQATRWARALLTLAAELDHAHAVAAHAIFAHRTGTTSTQNIRRWVTDRAHELTPEQRHFAKRLDNVLADEERIGHTDTLIAALDAAHPELPTSLAELGLLSRETLTHLHAADVIERLAAIYKLPFYLWTAKSRYIVWEIGGIPLSESEWRRVADTDEMYDFESTVENEQDNGGAALDIRLALQRAGVLCRVCGRRIIGEIVTTLGRCLACRPADPGALAKVLAAGCPGVEDDEENDSTHFLSDDRSCGKCGLPLPLDYHLVLEAEQAEYERENATRQAAMEQHRRIMAEARRLLAEEWLREADNLREAGHDVPEDEQARLLWVRRMADDTPEWEITQGYSSFLEAAKLIIEKRAADPGGDC
jgi:hypothetical protein